MVSTLIEDFLGGRLTKYSRSGRSNEALGAQTEVLKPWIISFVFMPVIFQKLELACGNLVVYETMNLLIFGGIIYLNFFTPSDPICLSQVYAKLCLSLILPKL